MSFGQLLILFSVAVTLHMIEEILWLPSWSQHAGVWHQLVDPVPFALASILYLAILYLLTYLALHGETQHVALYLVGGLVVVMLINVFYPHVAATIALRRYAPGLATSLLFILPLSSLIIYRALSEEIYSVPKFIISGLAVVAVAAIAWPRMMRLGARTA